MYMAGGESALVTTPGSKATTTATREYLERASRVAIDAGIGRGVLEDGGDRRLNCRGEEASQSSALFLIPDLPDPRMPTARRQTSSLGGTLGISGAAMTLTRRNDDRRPPPAVIR